MPASGIGPRTNAAGRFAQRRAPATYSGGGVWALRVSLLAVTACFAVVAHAQIPSSAKPTILVDTSAEPVAKGKFQPSWDSLAQYETPEWFRDAKFGIWAHWGPQCQPERGDWYAREMYSPGNYRYRFHVDRYGHPSEHGFKDVIHEWKGDKWDPGDIPGCQEPFS